MKKIIKYLFVTFIITLPLSTVWIFNERIIGASKWQYGTGQLFLPELILFLLIFLSTGWLTKTSGLNLKKFNFKNLDSSQGQIVLALWLFLGWASLSTLWSAEPTATYYLWVRFLEGGALLLLLLNLKLKKEWLLMPLAISAGLQALIAINQFISQSITANKLLGIATHSAEDLGTIVIETSSGRWLRAYGTLAHPNILGGLLIFGLIATMILYFQAGKKSQPLLMGLASLIGAGIFCSFSRSAFLALILIFICIGTITAIKFSKNYDNLKSLKPLSASLLIIISLSLIYQPLIQSRSQLTGRLENKSVQERLTQSQQAWQSIKTAPLIGVGLNSYTYSIWQQQQLLPIRDYQPVHNLFLLATAELGLIGLTLLLLLLITVIRQARQNHVAPVYYAPLLAFVIISFFDHYFWTQFTGIILFWLSLFLLLSVSKGQVDIK